MKFLSLLTLLMSTLTLFANNTTGIDNSLKLETLAVMGKAEKFILSQQNDNGSWGMYGGIPAYTALAATALKMSPHGSNYQLHADKAAEYLLKFINPDGSIHDNSEHAYPNYTTSCTLIALYYIDKAKYANIIRKGRCFLEGSQFGKDEGIEAGGIGYGSSKTKSDLSNTQYALEALYITSDVDSDAISPAEAAKNKQVWANAMAFVERCQSSEATDKKLGFEHKKENEGGFRYSPDRSKVDGEDKAPYGAMTYAGIKSMIYAKLSKDDPRIKAALTWVASRYTLDEHPGMKLQGHHYYLHTFAKALHVAEINTLKDSAGTEHFWRADLAKKMISVQQADGSWFNTEGRWQENDKTLVTSYGLMGLSYALALENDTK